MFLYIFATLVCCFRRLLATLNAVGRGRSSTSRTRARATSGLCGERNARLLHTYSCFFFFFCLSLPSYVSTLFIIIIIFFPFPKWPCCARRPPSDTECVRTARCVHVPCPIKPIPPRSSSARLVRPPPPYALSGAAVPPEDTRVNSAPRLEPFPPRAFTLDSRHFEYRSYRPYFSGF